MNKKQASLLGDNFFEKVSHNLPALVAVYNIKTGQYLYVNNTVKKLLGYTSSEFLKGGVAFAFSIVHPDDRPAIMAQNIKALKMANKKRVKTDSDEPIVAFEYRMKHKNGSWVWLKTDGSIFSRDEKGDVECVMNVSLDITARKEAEKKALLVSKQHKELNLSLTKNVSDGVVVTDTLYNIIGWNKGAEKMYGWREKEVLGKFSRDILKTEFVNEYSREIFWKEMEESGHWKGEVIQTCKDGSRIRVLGSTASVKDESGKVTGYIAINRDITREYEIEQKIEESEKLFRTLTGHAPVGIFQTDKDGNCVYVNERWRQMSGMKLEEALGQGWVKALHPDDSERISAEWYEFAKKGYEFKSEYRFVSKKGTVSWVRGSAVDLKNSRGETVGYIGTIVDITESKQTQDILQLHANILENVKDSVIVTDLGGCVTYWNKGAVKIFGYTEKEILGKSLKLIYPELDEDELARDLKKILNGEIYEGEWKGKRKDGLEVWVEVKTTVMKDKNGSATGFLGVAKDVTLRKDALDKLRKSEKRFRSIIDKSFEVVSLIGADGNVFYTSPSVERVLGYPHEKTKGSWFEFVHPDDRGESVKKFTTLVKHPGETATGIARVRHVDGSWRWIESVAQNLLHEPEVGAVVVNFRDITSQKQFEDELKNRKQELEVILKNISDGITVQAPTGNLIYMNDMAAQLMGFASYKELISTPREQIMSRYEIFSEDGQPFPVEELPGRRLLAGKEAFPTVVKFRIKNKPKFYWSMVKSTPVYDGNSELLYVINVFHDITAIKEAEQQAKASETEYRRMIDLSPMPIAIHSGGRVVYVNKIGLKVVGATSENQVVGQPVMRFVHPEYHEIVKERIMKVISGEQQNTDLIEEKFVRLDGTPIDVEVTSLLTSFEGKPAIQTLIQDITERKRIEETRSNLAAIVDSTDDAVIGKTLDGVITSWNKAAEELYGYAASEMIGASIEVIIPREKRKEYKAIMRNLKKGKAITHLETERIRKDGKKVLVSLTISPLKNDKGKVIGASTIARNISIRKALEADRKELHERLEREQERLTSLVGNVPGVVWEAYGKPDEAQQRIDFVSDYVEQMLGYSVEEWINTPNFWYTIVHPEDKERAAAEAAAIFSSGRKGISRFRWVRKDGSVIWVEAQSMVITDRKGQPIGMRGVTIDITERMKLEQQKDEFIAIASHELKTPVTSLRVYTHAIGERLKKAGDIELATRIRRMDSQLGKLSVLISDLLDASKIEGGKLQFNEEYFDFNSLIEEVVEEMQRTTQKHALVTKFDKPVKVFGDRDRIGQVLTNFLSNAIKYSPDSKEVVVETKLGEDGITLSVEDFGLGIPNGKKKRIFERFYRVEEGDNKTFPGLGLGLYISSEIIKRHGGKIGVNSVLGRGSKFYFFLPLGKKRTIN